MKLLLQLFLMVSIVFLGGCGKDPAIVQVKISDAVYQYRKVIKDRGDLLAFEKLLDDRQVSPPSDSEFFYVLEIQSFSKKEYWNYNEDGICVLLQDGKPSAFFRIKDPEAFNQLIGIKKKF